MIRLSKLLFYFDESHKHDVLRVNRGKLNFQMENDLQCFVSVSCGCLESDLPRIEEVYLDFEYKWKKIFGIKQDVEFKSTSLNRKELVNGFASCGSRNINFYKELIDNALNIQPLLQITVISEMDILLRKMFKISF